MPKILVIGATGTLGSELVRKLEQTGEPVRAATRTPAAAAALRTRTEFVEFDFERPETFAPALEGVDRVFLIARPGDEYADRVAFPFIDQMKRAAVRYVVNLTAMGTEIRPEFALRKVELYLEDSGIAYTHLRPNFFMQVFRGGPLLAAIRLTGAIRVPAADAKLSWIDVRDIAAVAAKAITEPQRHAGKAYTLTGYQAIDHYQVARAISDAVHRQIQYVPIGEDEAQSAIAAAGLSPQRVERLIGFYRLVREGYCAPISPDVSTILERPPLSFETFAQDHASVWS